MFSNIVFEKTGRIAVITLNRPRVLNALSAALKGELMTAFARIAADGEIRAVVLTGAGKAFSAGQDLNEAKDLDGAGAEEWVQEYARLYEAMRALEVPVVAAVHGWAVGAGCQLALLADIRLCATTARFGMPEVNDGIPAIFGLTFLSNVIGMSRATAMVLTGEPLSAREALAAGLVTKVLPPARLLREAKGLARKLASFTPLANRLNKAFMRELTAPQFRAAVAFARSAHHRAFEAGDAKAAMEAFLAG